MLTILVYSLFKLPLMNNFGGNWTEQKMEIVVSYAKAYLTIMNAQKWAKTIYFDGFAGSGSISEERMIGAPVNSTLFGDIPELSTQLEFSEIIKKGTALRILDIIKPKPFDMYYFVEKNETHFRELKAQVELNYADRNAHVVREDCNDKLVSMASFLSKNKSHKALAFIDPYGMSVKWSSIEALKGLGVDLWILVPTGVGANRLLVRDGEIPESWLSTLESFLGITRDEIMKQFYRQVTVRCLFTNEETSIISKEADTVNKLGRLYTTKLQEVFKFVSEPFVLRNSTNSIMYHFMMATNNKAALDIANDVIKPKYKL